MLVQLIDAPKVVAGRGHHTCVMERMLPLGTAPKSSRAHSYSIDADNDKSFEDTALGLLLLKPGAVSLKDLSSSA